jgi:broad specificity phosphatase PhoE
MTVLRSETHELPQVDTTHLQAEVWWSFGETPAQLDERIARVIALARLKASESQCKSVTLTTHSKFLRRLFSRFLEPADEHSLRTELVPNCGCVVVELLDDGCVANPRVLFANAPTPPDTSGSGGPTAA